MTSLCNVKKLGRLFQNCVAFSEYLNFTYNREYFVATNVVGSDLGANFINDENIHLEIFLISIRFREETAILKMLPTHLFKRFDELGGM